MEIYPDVNVAGPICAASHKHITDILNNMDNTTIPMPLC